MGLRGDYSRLCYNPVSGLADGLLVVYFCSSIDSYRRMVYALLLRFSLKSLCHERRMGR